MRIQINNYPSTFSFHTRKKLPEFEYGCQTRVTILHKKMNKLKPDSPYHSYEDFTVEVVYKTPDGEIWQLGS